MASIDLDALFTYEGRLASFKRTTKKRGSTANGRAKVLNWPHKQITPASLAKAGFYFNPNIDNPDNVQCFLCDKSLDGWEAGDDPLREHLTHASHCGWAVLAATEVGYDEFAAVDPMETRMSEARLATFGDRWPHEGKKGWVCKTDKLVEAGWKYTPTADSDDMATCTYCSLALDGWEPSDEPYEEHYKRSPNCAFFALGGLAKTPAKKPARGKGSRVSKTSRISTQSTISVADTTAVADETADPEDSVMTTASTMTQGGTKKPRAKKGAAKPRGRPKKAKKEEEVKQEEDDDDVVIIEAPPAPSPAPAPVPAKSTRGRKRGSAAVEDSIVSTASAPATKKRATRKASTATANTSVATVDTEMAEAPQSKTPAPKSSRASTKSRKASTASVRAMASLRATSEDLPDDDEIERQLEADLERQLSEDEVADELPSSPVPVVKALPKTKGKKSAEYAMFDPEPVVAESSDIEDELEALQRQMEDDAEHTQELKIAKNNRTATAAAAANRKASAPRKASTTRKVSAPRKVSAAQARRPKAPSPPSPEEEVEDPISSAVEDALESEDENDTIVQSSPVRPSSASRGRSRTRTASIISQDSEAMVTCDEPETEQEEDDVAPSVAAESEHETEHETEAESVQETEQETEPETEQDEEDDEEEADVVAELPRPKAPVLKKPRMMNFDSSSPAPRQVINNDPTTSEFEGAFSDDFEVAEDPSSPMRPAAEPTTPTQQTASFVSPAPSAQQAALSPSQSPQSSDAENQPPSTAAKRPALAVVTPTRNAMSPSKRNIIAGLKTTAPWTAANLDAIFSKEGKENGGFEKFLKQGKELSSEEKAMTVEQWIYFNAAEAEERLKMECELMVSRFETEGSRAMKALEGLVVD